MEKKQENSPRPSLTKEEVRRRLPIMISMFNHKGGIGKTTSTYNLGYQLYIMGFRVLMVDADPQSSLSTVIRPYTADVDKALTFSRQFETKFSEEKIRQRLDHVFDELIFRQRVPSRGDAKDIAKKVVPQLVHDYGDEGEKEKPALFLLPGHVKFERLSRLISTGFEGMPLYKSTIRYQANMFRNIGRSNNIDFILLDLSPSISSLNQSLIMFSDYLFVPFKCELGCYDAVRNISEQVREWFTEMRKINAGGVGLNEEEGPIFLGTFPQLMRTKKNEAGVPKGERAYQKWMKKILESTYQLNSMFKDMMPKQKLLPLKLQCRYSGVPDMVGAGKASEESGRPLSDLNYRHEFIRSNARSQKFSSSWREKKVLTQLAYRRILSNMFSSMTKEHFTWLATINTNFEFLYRIYTLSTPVAVNDMVKDINVEKIIGKGHHASAKKSHNQSSAKSLLDSASKVSQSKRRIDVDHFWYADEHISFLFNQYLSTKPNFHFMTPLPADEKNVGNLKHQITDFMTNLIADSPLNFQDVTQTVFIPLNLGNVKQDSNSSNRQGSRSGLHWTLAFFQFQDAKVSNIYYFDSCAAAYSHVVPEFIYDPILGALKEVFIDSTNLREDSFITANESLQHDSYNCGPWIVEAARCFSGVHPSADFLAEVKPNEARQEHLRLMNANPRFRRLGLQSSSSSSSSPQGFFFQSEENLDARIDRRRSRGENQERTRTRRRGRRTEGSKQSGDSRHTKRRKPS